MCTPAIAPIVGGALLGGAVKGIGSALTPKFPTIPKQAAPPPPPLVEKTATSLEQGKGLRDAQRLASRLGTGQLIVPFSNVNVPN